MFKQTPLVQNVKTNLMRFDANGNPLASSLAPYTSTTLDTPFPTIANATDGDLTTDTGTGIKAFSATGGAIDLFYDLGASYLVDIGVIAKLWTTSGATNIFMSIGSSNSSFAYDGYPSFNANPGATSEPTDPHFPKVVRGYGRYIKFHFSVSGATNPFTMSLKIASLIVNLVSV
jgi:hypothetical protein